MLALLSRRGARPARRRAAAAVIAAPGGPDPRAAGLGGRRPGRLGLDHPDPRPPGRPTPATQGGTVRVVQGRGMPGWQITLVVATAAVVLTARTHRRAASIIG
jgi:hypothetical protein